MRLLSVLMVVLLAAPAAAQTVPAIPDPYFPAPAEVAVEAAKLDGRPFELDAEATLAALTAFSGAVSGQRIYDCITGITTDFTTSYRLMGTPSAQLFVQKYAGVFKDLGLPSALQTFADGGPGVPGVGGGPVATGGTNIVGALAGKDTHKWVVVGGHYDTQLLTQGGGAFDNTSGICTVLELARQMKAYVDSGGVLQASVLFVWYDGEEWGLYGSVAFAQDQAVARALLGLSATDKVDVLTSQSYDMVGLNWPAGNNWVGFGDPAATQKTAVLNLRTAPIHNGTEWACWSYGCYEELKVRPDFDALLANFTNYQFLVREVAYDLLKCPPEFCWVYDDSYGRSDHIPIIATGVPGNRVQGSHDFEYPHYHYPSDTLPAMVELAGSQAALVQGFDAESRIGGTVAFYTALTGGVGHYGYKEDPNLFPVALGKGDTGTSKGTPLGEVALLGLALAGFAIRRKR